MPIDVVNDASAFLLPGWVAGRVPPHALSARSSSRAPSTCAPAGHDARREALPLNDEVFEGDDEKQSLRYPGDAALFKPKADVLLVGDCVPPGGKNARPCRSTSRWARGRRAWPSSATGAGPEHRLQVHRTRTFQARAAPLGELVRSPGYAMNPIGRGTRARCCPTSRSRTAHHEPLSPACAGRARADPRTWPSGPAPREL